MIAKLFLLALFAVVTSKAALSPAISDANCKNKGVNCLMYPKGCSLASCDSFMKWELKGDHLLIEMRTKWTGSNAQRYVAFVASDDSGMTKNPTEFCHSKAGSVGAVSAGYLTSKATPTVLNSASYITVEGVKATSNMLECRFKRMLKVSGSGMEKHSLDPKKKYYILGAFGAMSTSAVNVLNKHDNYYRTMEAMMLSKGTFTSASVSSILLGFVLAFSKLL